MAKEKAVLIITADQHVIGSLPESAPPEREVILATSLEQAVHLYDEAAARLSRVYLDLRTPRVDQGRPGPFPDGDAFIRDHLAHETARGTLLTIVDCNPDHVDGRIERSDVGQTVDLFLNAPE